MPGYSERAWPCSIIFAIVWPLRNRIQRTGMLVWLVLGLFAVGRFFEFFFRSDSPELWLGLNNGQWTGVALVAASAFGASVTSLRSRPAADADAGTVS